MSASTLKGWFHASLVVAAAAEALSSKSKLRTLLLGCCAGWHLYATIDHFVFEPKENLPKLPEGWWGNGTMFYTDSNGTKWIDDRPPLDLEKLRRDKRNTWGGHDD